MADCRSSKALLLGVDARVQSLMDAIASAGQDGNRYHSVLMRAGAADALPLLDARSPDARAAGKLIGGTV
jgi:hypothetical protein